MFTDKLTRITSSTSYLPFIDGLRFLAILPVVLVHCVDFYDLHFFKISDTATYRQFHFSSLIGNSDNSVLLFFVISGFILGLPFAKSILNNHSAPKLSAYYLRRVTRLEPPYLILLTALFILNVFVLHKFSVSDMFPSYLASFFYVHNIVFESYPYLNFVFWSLEIEVQFYLIAPLLVSVFRLKSQQRRILLVSGVLLFGLLNYYVQFSFISFLNYIQYFLAGFLVLDLYLNTKIEKNWGFDILALTTFLLFWTSYITNGILLPFLFVGFIYFSIGSSLWYKLISLKALTIIGGMCYTIYMLHHPVMAFFMNRFYPGQLLFNSIYIDFAIKMLLSLIVVSVASVIYFIAIERPFMKKKWNIKKIEI